jgi:hypothetical protein
MHQYRLSMVVNGMPHRHPSSPNRPGYFSQKGISYLTRRLFQRNVPLCLISSYVTRLYSGGNAKTVSYVKDIPGIRLSLIPSQLVVEMSHMQLYAKLVL